MSKALRSWRRHKDGRDGNDADVRPLEEKFRDLEFRVSELEKRPVALTPVNDQQAIPAAIGELLKRIEALEQSPPTEPAELKEEIDRLNEKIADFARANLEDLLEHAQRLDTMDTRIKNMPGRLRKFFADEFERIA